MTGFGAGSLTDREPRLSPADAARLRASATYLDYPRNTVLTMPGAAAEHVFLLTRGMVKVVGDPLDGGPRLLAVHGRGHLVGDLDCIDGARTTAAVVAVTAVAAWRLPAEAFLLAVHEDPELCFALLEVAVARVREAQDELGALGALGARDRVVRLLARLVATCLDDQPGDSVTIPVDQAELAGGAGVARETVCRTVTMLSRRGIAHTRRGRIMVDDVPALLQQARKAAGG
ncbi:MAG TPA: Crp/Fnr family transcriptional regulator [Actinocrinis sp.]|nr:Crp/Fnr family transcriptional regulator [Actinocrinis sp.]